MRIGIDARLYGPKHTGIGRYVKNLIDHLVEIDHQNHYILFGDQEVLSVYSQYKNVKIINYTPHVYTIAEQLGALIFLWHRLDLLHIPHINSPIFYPKKII